MEKKKAMELQAENATLKAKNMLLESGREAKGEWIEAAANIVDETKRKAFVDSLPIVEGIERPQFIPPLLESVDDKDFDFSAPGSFASRYL